MNKWNICSPFFHFYKFRAIYRAQCSSFFFFNFYSAHNILSIKNNIELFVFRIETIFFIAQQRTFKLKIFKKKKNILLQQAEYCFLKTYVRNVHCTQCKLYSRLNINGRTIAMDQQIASDHTKIWESKLKNMRDTF